MTKKYLLMELSWEYNDEYYYRPESGGGNPVKLFNTKEAAMKERDTLEEGRSDFLSEVREGREYMDVGDGEEHLYEIVEVESED